MPFILADGCLEKFYHLREHYEEARKIKLNVDPSKFSMPIKLGGIDVKTRRAQIGFEEKMLFRLNDELFPKDVKNALQNETQITAIRTILAVYDYILSQIDSESNSVLNHSVLYQLIKDNLGITASNFMDDADKLTCYRAADRFLRSTDAFEKANAVLRTGGMDSFSEIEWAAFAQFILEKCKARPADDNDFANNPVSSVTVPMFGALGFYAGTATGYITGDFVSKSSQALPFKFQVTTAVSTVLFLGQMSPTAISLFAPIIATKLLAGFCSISLAHVMGVAMGLLGQGVGKGVGLPLDLSYQLICKACSLVSAYYAQQQQLNTLSGLRIVDGRQVVNGIIVEELKAADLAKENDGPLMHLEIHQDGTMTIDGQKVDLTDPNKQLPPEVMSSMKLALEQEFHSKVEEYQKSAAHAI